MDWARTARRYRAGGSQEELFMQDLMFVAITIAFFALSIGYVYFCDRVR